jgi:hypothetical protein
MVSPDKAHDGASRGCTIFGGKIIRIRLDGGAYLAAIARTAAKADR